MGKDSTQCLWWGLNQQPVDPRPSTIFSYPDDTKELCAFRGYFGPPMKLKNKDSFSSVSSYKFIKTIAQMLKYGINLIFTVAMVTQMAAAKVGWKWKSDHSGANLKIWRRTLHKAQANTKKIF